MKILLTDSLHLIDLRWYQVPPSSQTCHWLKTLPDSVPLRALAPKQQQPGAAAFLGFDGLSATLVMWGYPSFFNGRSSYKAKPKTMCESFLYKLGVTMGNPSIQTFHYRLQLFC